MLQKLITMCVMASILSLSCSKSIVDFEVKSEKMVAPAYIKFENKTTSSERFEWDFGDGEKSSDVSPTHQFTQSGQYTITLVSYNKSRKKSLKKNIEISPPENCLIEMKTSLGIIILQLYDATPRHREHYLSLIQKGLLDSTLFHRVINGFMIQGGDLSSIPNLSASTKKDQLILNRTKLYPEIVDTLIHERGALAAARFSDDINPQKLSSPTQFYIVHGTSLNESMIRKSRGINNDVLPSVVDKYLTKGGSPQLDGEYTVFGKVLYGLDVVDKIATSPTDSNDKPINEIRIISIKAIN